MCDPKRTDLKKALDTMVRNSAVVPEVDTGYAKSQKTGAGFGRGREQRDCDKDMCKKECNKDSAHYSSILEDKNAACTTWSRCNEPSWRDPMKFSLLS